MANFTDPIKEGFGRFLHGFHSQLIADTKALREFATRDFSKAAVWAPGRMVDQVDDMLASWRKNDTSQAAQPKTLLPIMIVAMVKDFVAAPPEFGRGGSDPLDVTISADPKGRVFKMRTVTADIRTQVVIVAADDPTARSIAMQLHAYTAAIGNRRFAAIYRLAGLNEKWPVVFELPDLMAPAMPTEQKNLTILAADLTLRATVPMLTAPKSTQPNDGQGQGTNMDDPFGPGYDPSGYLVVSAVEGWNYPPQVGAPSIGNWSPESVSSTVGP